MTDSSRQQPQLVRDLMTVGVATCPPETPAINLARLILDQNIEAIVVLEEGNAIGIVSQNELVRVYARGDYAGLSARDIMNEDVPQVPPDIPLAAAAQLMLDNDTRVLFLMHHSAGVEYPAGVISFRHLIRHFAARDPNELRDLGIIAERQLPLEAFIRKRDAARKNKKNL
jgi:crotonyl-CoA carboxylase/reductase